MCWSTINFFDQALKRKQEANEKLVGIPKNNDYATEKLLDYCYDQNYFKLIGTHGKIRRRWWCNNVFFVAEKLQKAFLKFSIDSLIVAI